MVFNKPHDIAVWVTIFALIIATTGIIMQNYGSFNTTLNNTYYEETNTRILSSNGFKGSAEDSIEVVENLNGSNNAKTTANILTKGFTGIINLGSTFGTMWSEVNEIVRILHIPNIYITLLFGLIAITFVVVVYTWIRAGT